MELVKVTAGNGLWAKLLDQWRGEAEAYDEDFDVYESGALSVVKDLAEGPDSSTAGVYALEKDGRFVALAQLNCARLPKTIGITLRVRMMVLSPEYDLGTHSVDDYITITTNILFNVVDLATCEMPAQHVKFHLRSPADRQFFTLLGTKLGDKNVFENVNITGSWLYITL